MSTRRSIRWCLGTVLAGSVLPALAAGPSLGQRATPEQVAAVDISVAPDGATLPPGSGTPAAGETVYQAKCMRCHGAGAAGGKDADGNSLADPLVGGIGSLTSAAPTKTVGSFWPYATTLFDYTRRAMPLDAPMSLTDGEVYAVTAYILSLNGIIEGDAVMNAQTLPKVEMPNRNGFESVWPQ